MKIHLHRAIAALALCLLGGCPRAVECDNGSYCPAGSRCLPQGGCGGDSGGCPTGECRNGQNVCVSAQSDPDNCGSCGVVCESRACSAGRCTPRMVATADQATGLAASASGDALWFTINQTPPGGAVMRIDTANLSVTPIATGRNQPLSVAVDNTNVFWTEHNASGGVFRAPLAGGVAPSSLTPSALNQPYGITLDNQMAYVTLEGNQSTVRIAKTGGAPGAIGFTENGPHGVAVLAGSPTGTLYWINRGTGTLRSAATDGSGLRDILTNLAAPESVALFSSQVYFTTATTVSRLSGTTPNDLATSQQGPVGLASDGTFLYFTNRGTAPGYADGAVMKVPLAGGTPTTLATGQRSPWSIAVAGNYVYWTNNATGGNLWRLPKD